MGEFDFMTKNKTVSVYKPIHDLSKDDEQKHDVFTTPEPPPRRIVKDDGGMGGVLMYCIAGLIVCASALYYFKLNSIVFNFDTIKEESIKAARAAAIEETNRILNERSGK